MENNTLEYKQIKYICDQIENNTNEIFESMMKIAKIVENMPILFQDEDVKKICDMIQNEEIVNMKKENDKVNLIKNVLINIAEAYKELDNYYSLKKVI